VTGLQSGATLALTEAIGQNSFSDVLTIADNGSFVFPTPVASGVGYRVTISSTPSNEVCSITNGTGTVGSGDVTDIAVSCAPPVAIGGTVTGIGAFDSVVLQDNLGDTLTLSANGSFTLPGQFQAGQPYSVTTLRQLGRGQCSVTKGTGTAGTSDVTTVRVTCVEQSFLVVVQTSVPGLFSDGTDTVLVERSSVFAFPTALADGASYSVTGTSSCSPVVLVPIVTADDTGTINDGTGTINGADVYVWASASCP
jgi:hypothetical protein